MRFLAAFLAVFFVARAAAAHDVGLSRGDYALHGRELDAELVFSKAELDRPLDGLHVTADGASCAARWSEGEPVEGDAVRTRVHFECPAAPRELVLHFDFLDRFTPGHQHLVHVSGDASLDAVATLSQREVRVTRSAKTGAFALIWMGITHILTGWDHLAFLVGLVVVGGRWRSILAAITAFTIAHSITLGFAAFGVVRGSPLFVEPLIALSVVYVAIENFRVSSIEGRWRITLPFGLIHGFGFAGALASLALPRARIPMALFSFNLGVEIGQLAVLTVVLPILWLLRKAPLFQKWGVRGISAAIAAAGVIWFVMRVISS
jgi:hypothetical protein